MNNNYDAFKMSKFHFPMITFQGYQIPVSLVKNGTIVETPKFLSQQHS